jgi:SAM-dependent methyltransferase
MLSSFRSVSILRWLNSLFNFSQLIGVFLIPKFILNYIRYSQLASTHENISWADLYPCLTDSVVSTPFDPHYFYQSAWLSRELSKQKPSHHVDVGSDIKLIASVSGFIEMTFVDYRPLPVSLSGLKSVKGDILNLSFANNSISSISCLHVIEHIGLGRYGDPLDPEGSVKAAQELIRVLKSGGYLYLSLPIGKQRVCFNAHRVFLPKNVVEMFSPLELISFSYVNDLRQYYYNSDNLELSDQNYACGMFVFRK